MYSSEAETNRVSQLSWSTCWQIPCESTSKPDLQSPHVLESVTATQSRSKWLFSTHSV